jgi:hypothetical protein
VNPARIRLRRALDDLKEFHLLLDAIEGLAAVAAEAPPDPTAFRAPAAGVVDHVDPARLHQLGYLTTFVLGYAGFERFVRDLIGFTAGVLALFVDQYDELPRTLRDNHIPCAWPPWNWRKQPMENRL